MIAPGETPQADTTVVAVDYTLPLDRMSPEQQEAARQYAIEDTIRRINAERLTHGMNHAGRIAGILQSNR